MPPTATEVVFGIIAAAILFTALLELFDCAIKLFKNKPKPAPDAEPRVSAPEHSTPARLPNRYLFKGRYMAEWSQIREREDERCEGWAFYDLSNRDLSNPEPDAFFFTDTGQSAQAILDFLDSLKSPEASNSKPCPK